MMVKVRGYKTRAIECKKKANVNSRVIIDVPTGIDDRD